MQQQIQLELNAKVRFHPIIGLRHDGTIRLIEGWFTDRHGQTRVFITGSVGSAAIESLSPVAGL